MCVFCDRTGDDHLSSAELLARTRRTIGEQNWADWVHDVRAAMREQDVVDALGEARTASILTRLDRMERESDEVAAHLERSGRS